MNLIDMQVTLIALHPPLGPSIDHAVNPPEAQQLWVSIMEAQVQQRDI